MIDFNAFSDELEKIALAKWRTALAGGGELAQRLRGAGAQQATPVLRPIRGLKQQPKYLDVSMPQAAQNRVKGHVGRLAETRKAMRSFKPGGEAMVNRQTATLRKQIQETGSL